MTNHNGKTVCPTPHLTWDRVTLIHEHEPLQANTVGLCLSYHQSSGSHCRLYLHKITTLIPNKHFVNWGCQQGHVYSWWRCVYIADAVVMYNVPLLPTHVIWFSICINSQFPMSCYGLCLGSTAQGLNKSSFIYTAFLWHVDLTTSRYIRRCLAVTNTHSAVHATVTVRLYIHATVIGSAWQLLPLLIRTPTGIEDVCESPLLHSA